MGLVPDTHTVRAETGYEGFTLLLALQFGVDALYQKQLPNACGPLCREILSL